ncbi:putative bifunctional diguanylate cyclase/phosphodiesterase [Consotaella aegiceratis]|uniref:putative bifunctional diguanylate cyclase/phosphodiesterase n=1 Tax=Consotaella aegiceratis TaxID=3097961 RepID=UPI002F42EF24
MKAGFLHSRARRDAVLAVVIALGLYALFLYVDLYDSFHTLMVEHETWELDEIVTAFLVAGIGGFLYAWRRVVDLRAEMQRRTEAEDEALWFAYHDPLTRLPDRHYVEAKLSTDDEIPYGVQTLFGIDLDGFKKVNDLVGHHGGDELLIEMAERLRQLFPDDTVLRMGGDEFCVLSAVDAGEEAIEMAQRIVRVLSRPATIDGLRVEVGASVGVAYCPDHATQLSRGIEYADLAMYAAKRRSRNGTCVYEPSMHETLSERIKLEAELREAIRADLIEPHYQPLIRLADGEVHGFEALARWTNAKGISVPPSIFIEVAEEAGLITDLSARLLRRACLDALSWPKHVRLAFNISPAQLTDRLLGLRIVQILGETGFPPHRLEIEVTESAIVRELEAATEIINGLKTAGVHIALDDFGTGYSSLSQLANLAFDEIKIDRSFIDALNRGEEKRVNIVKAIVGLSQRLGISTTAEGIEQKEQLEQLKALGCDIGQGYLFAKAMPAGEVAEFVGRHRSQSVAAAVS